jgi:hypothetical protein
VCGRGARPRGQHRRGEGEFGLAAGQGLWEGVADGLALGTNLEPNAISSAAGPQCSREFCGSQSYTILHCGAFNATGASANRLMQLMLRISAWN